MLYFFPLVHHSSVRAFSYCRIASVHFKPTCPQQLSPQTHLFFIMSISHFTCRWAFLRLSNIAGVFLPYILPHRDESVPIEYETVAVSTTESSERATKWLTNNKASNTNSAKISDLSVELQSGDFDIVSISTLHPLHYQAVRTALECKRNVLIKKGNHESCAVRGALPTP